MYVCLSVTGLRFTHSLRTSLACAAHDAITVEVKDLKIGDDARMSLDVWKMVNCSTKG